MRISKIWPFLLLAVILAGCSVMPPLYKSKFIAVFHLIEISNYPEAKQVVEELVEDEKFSQIPRTWYARGLLSQTAYQEGIRKNNRRMYELYPDQLFVAYESFEKALALDSRNTMKKQLAPRYVLLANDFQKLGTQHYNAKRYKEALRAFEKALTITESPILTVETDTNLIYNVALAAIESKEDDKAFMYLNRLDAYNFSTNVSHLLFTAYLERGDTLAAESVLREGVEKYEDNEDLYLLLVDLNFKQGNMEGALEILDAAAIRNPDSHVYPYTKGLIYQKSNQYIEAIDAYMLAVDLAPEEFMIYANIATCYYNIGVEIDENARQLTSIIQVASEKARSKAAFESATFWLGKAEEVKTENHSEFLKLQQLLKRINISDRAVQSEGIRK
jgi:tetratricopeptide (TPR) repeat protein